MNFFERNELELMEKLLLSEGGGVSEGGVNYCNASATINSWLCTHRTRANWLCHFPGLPFFSYIGALGVCECFAEPSLDSAWIRHRDVTSVDVVAAGDTCDIAEQDMYPFLRMRIVASAPSFPPHRLWQLCFVPVCSLIPGSRRTIGLEVVVPPVSRCFHECCARFLCTTWRVDVLINS